MIKYHVQIKFDKVDICNLHQHRSRYIDSSMNSTQSFDTGRSKTE